MLSLLGHVLPESAKLFGNKTALVFDGEEFTYTALNELSDSVAAGLRKLGVKEGDRVTLYAHNCWEWIVSYYGALKLGAIINPLNVMLTTEEVHYAVEDCGASVILASKSKGEELLVSNDAEKKPALILFGEDIPHGAHSFNAMIEENPGSFSAIRVESESVSTICYTSGTTGHPKGAMLTHSGVLLNSKMTGLMHGRSSEDVVVSALPCAHVYGNVVMNSAFMTGMTLVMHSVFEAKRVLNDVQHYRATIFDGVPTMYLYLLNEPSLNATDLSSLRLCSVGGQTMPTPKMELVEEAFGCPLIELWGMTEVGGLGTTHTYLGPNTHGSIGVPMPHVEAQISDMSNSKVVLPVGEAGELMVRGPIVMKGYYGNEEATAEAFSDTGWLRTGDIAYKDSEGNIFLVDRKKDLIITAGFNIYPAEIERVISSHPKVSIVAVGSIPDSDKGEIAKAYIIPVKAGDLVAEEIFELCRKKLANYKVPRAIEFVDKLPMTSTGKVMRRELGR